MCPADGDNLASLVWQTVLRGLACGHCKPFMHAVSKIMPSTAQHLKTQVHAFGKFKAALKQRLTNGSLQSVSGRLNVMHSDLPHAAFWGEDFQPNRRHLFHVSNIPPGTTQYTLAQAAASLGYGWPRAKLEVHAIPLHCCCTCPFMLAADACHAWQRLW